MTITLPSLKRVSWWPLLVPLAGVVVTLAIYHVELMVSKPCPEAIAAAKTHVDRKTGTATKRHHTSNAPAGAVFWSLQFVMDEDYVSVPLIGLAAVLYCVAAAKRRSILFGLLAVMAINFTFRELREHPQLEFMYRWVYVFAGAIAVLGVVFIRRVVEEFNADPRHASWMLAMMFAYFIAIVEQRRAFAFIPEEQSVHRSLEECMEDIAHVVYILSAVMALRGPAKAALAAKEAPAA